MIDVTKYSKSSLLQLLKSNPEFANVIADAKEWEEVVAVIDTLVTYTEEQINYVKLKQWS